MKILRLILLFATCIILCICKSEMKTTERRPPRGCVWLFSRCYYSGKRIQICRDNRDFRRIRFNDLASSIMVGRNAKARLFRNINFSGSSRLFLRDHPCFRTIRFDNMASSIRLLR